MPNVSFDEDLFPEDVVISTGTGSEDSLRISSEFDAKFGKPKIEDTFSYTVVSRLSRWDGGNSTPYHQDGAATVKMLKPEKMSIGEFFRQLCHPTYDLTEITIEDIERVKFMHDRFLSESQFNFNYSTLLMIASFISAFGLAMDSTPSIIASMLVSPLMGPVTAIAYGSSIGDYKMVRMAVVTEIISLIFCVVVGCIISGILMNLPVANDWPVPAMVDRTTQENFFIGIPIAFFSGLGVAVGILDDQTNSLVGVAISASLLPPAVNAGMFWIFLEEDDTHIFNREGVTSLVLAVMNIVVIIFSSMCMFRLKEIAPIEKSIFWSDLGVARKIYHNVAILPNIQTAPDDEEIKKRVAMCFPRASKMMGSPAPMNKKSKKSTVEKESSLLSLIGEE